MKIRLEPAAETPAKERKPGWYTRKVSVPLGLVVALGVGLLGIGGSAVFLKSHREIDFGPQARSSAAFLKTDTTTLGNWKGAYGAVGFVLANDETDTPPYARITPPQNNKAVTWVSGINELRALQMVKSPGRIAATWCAWGSFDIDVDLKGDKTHRIALYVLDWDSNTRVEKLEVLDAKTNQVLDVREAGNFTDGAYFCWNMTGHVSVRITHLAGANAVASAVFVD